MGPILLGIAIIFLVFLFLGTPIGFVLGIAGLYALLSLDMPILLNMVPQRFFAGLDMFTLMAMPFFIMAGEIMNATGITRRLVAFANVLVGHLRGGLAHANILASVFFAGMTGAAVSDTAAIGTMLIPAMVEDGYDVDFSAAVTAASSIIGPTIPPSNMMVIYGSLMSVSIAGLFAAGVVPGLLLAAILMLFSAYISAKRGYPKKEKAATLREIVVGFRDAIVALFMPVLILGGILTGAFTPTEAAAVAVFYAFVIGFFVFRTLKISDIPRLLERTARTTGVVFLIIATASILGWVLASERVPESVAAAFMSVTTNKYGILLMINLLMLVVGMFMDIAAALIILGPILHPLAVNAGVHPLHFGIVMVLSLNIALMTPPVGACLFVACGISKLRLEQLSRAIFPFIIAEAIVLFVITFFDFIPLLVPRLLGLA
ncbi:MAG: TRAP transporter large permease [Firmicutes bacterium]|nr:TRAP transporter large permease [Bacillota bacterium]